MDYELTRRPSAVAPPSALVREPRREVEQSDYFGRRDTSHPIAYQPPPPPSASVTAGLDYGPPPAAPAITLSEKPPPPQPRAVRPESPAQSATPFQPPSGPKADRLPQSTSHSQKPAAHLDVLKGDTAQQGSKVAATSSPTELFPRKMEPKSEPKPPMAHTPDKTMPPNVPSGPRSSFGSSFRSRPPLSETGTSFLTPKTSPGDSRGPPIPTGPRLVREREVNREVRESRDGVWPPTQPGTSSRSWISPEYNRAKPSIMSPINRERPAFAPTGPRSLSILPPSNDKTRGYPSSNAPSINGLTTSPKPTGRPLSVIPRAEEASEDADMSLPVSSDEEADEDEFDEDDFAASEQKYANERRLLEARKPPPLLHDMTIRGLLVKMQLMNMIANQVEIQPMQNKDLVDASTKEVGHAQIGLPSPAELSEGMEKPDIKHPQPRGRPLREPPVNPIPTPPIEDLPYLTKQNSQPIVFEDSDDEVQRESVMTLIRQEFEREAFDWQDELQEMSAEYQKNYTAWKQDTANLDHALRETQLSPAPASPAPSAAPSVTASVNHERTRGGRNTTEADLQAAIALSQQTMKEEEERREREAASSSVPNYDHEADVPAMAKPLNDELSLFEDTNKLIPIELALEVFAYVPPEDDFTPEEQLAFIQAYCQTPKKWGKIAEALPGRSYQDCITHYYLTKGDAKYKDIWRRSQPKRRRGRAATKPRSTALMSELVYRDGEEGVVAVTDTGRPRRAAAPTFGDTAVDSDPATVAPAAKRLAVSGKDAAAEGVVKGSRGRKAGTTTKTRRTKAQILADQQAAQAVQATQAAALLPANLVEGSPQKVVVLKERSRPLLRVGEVPPKTEVVPDLDVHKLPDSDMPQYVVADPDRLMPVMHGNMPNQPTSYWSVPEQQKFPQLIGYYGRDFAAISDFMKTKTSTMVSAEQFGRPASTNSKKIKNHYNRQIAEGRSELGDMAKMAESRRANNEDMGRPPSPAVQTKRRYEATPSAASPQHGRALLDQHVPEPDHMGMLPKTTYTDDFPPNAVQRNLTGDIVAKARPGRDLIQEPLMVHPKPEELRHPGILSHKPLVGPRSGFFTDDGPAYGVSHQGRSRDNSPHQHPLRPGEHRLVELGQAIPTGSPRQLNLGPPRDPISLTAHLPTSIPLAMSSMHNDRFGLSQQLSQQHSRNGSIGNTASASLEPARDLTSLRQVDPMPGRYSMIPPQTATPPPTSSAPLRRTESGPGFSSAPPTDPPRAAPAKRSNINSLLNDEPSEPKAVKRSSFDSQKRSAMMSPQTMPHHGSPFEASRNSFRLDGSPAELDRNIRTPLSGLGPHPLREQQQAGYPSGQSATPSDDWLGRYDPRPQSGIGEARSLHPSPRTAQYSVVPPPTGGSNLRMEASRPGEAPATDHRRSLLSSSSHPGLNPSPPPQQQMAPYRSLPGSAQPIHSRIGSIGYPHPHTSQAQPPQLQHAVAGANHPQSTSSTPVPSLHHHRPSLDYGSQQRQTIQQHMAHLQQQRDPPGFRDRDHEQAVERQRQQEVQQQQMRAPDRDRDLYGYRRDLLTYSGGLAREQEAQPPHSIHQQAQAQLHHPAHQPQHHGPSGLGQARTYGYGQDHPQRSHTPAQQRPQHTSYQTSLTPAPPPQIQHHHHGQGGQQDPHLHGPPPPPGVHATNHGTYGHGHSHFRAMSQDERRYE